MARITAVIGMQWGDEGKGKAVDYLAKDADIVIRATGGNNTGRTVVNEYGEIALHLVPAGIFNLNTTCVIGHGTVVDIRSLIAEIDSVEAMGIKVTPERLMISPRAHLIMPWHIMTDEAQEKQRGEQKIGTTLRGVGPCYTDKIARSGLRIGDILKPDFRDRFLASFETKRKMIRALYGKRIRQELCNELLERYEEYIERVEPFISDVTSFILKNVDRNNVGILLEGSQGALLDPDFGIDYPFVTSSPVTVAGLSQGSGIPPNKINKIVGIVKAYTTRVAAGPFPTEMSKGEAEFIREKGKEFGATTGRPRRCGWLDLSLLKYAARFNGVNSIALTKIDILGLLDQVRVSTGYRLFGETFNFDGYFSLDEIEHCEPIYKNLAGWGGHISDVRTFSDLPSSAREYIEFIEDSLKIPVEIISTGADRKKLIIRT